MKTRLDAARLNGATRRATAGGGDGSGWAEIGDRRAGISQRRSSGECSSDGLARNRFLLLKILAVLVLVALNGFVATEFALVKVRVTQLDPLAARGNRRADMARHVIANLDAYLSAAQLGITLSRVSGWAGSANRSSKTCWKPIFGALNMAAEHETLRKTTVLLRGRLHLDHHVPAHRGGRAGASEVVRHPATAGDGAVGGVSRCGRFTLSRSRSSGC